MTHDLHSSQGEHLRNPMHGYIYHLRYSRLWTQVILWGFMVDGCTVLGEGFGGQGAYDSGYMMHRSKLWRCTIWLLIV